MTTEITARLDAIRTALRAQSISYGELTELQNLAGHIAPGDVELLEPAGVPEHGAMTRPAVIDATETEVAILQSFVTAALWADAHDENGEDVDTSAFTADDVTADFETWAKVRAMIRAFLTELEPVPHVTGQGVQADARRIVHEDPQQAGHDLWLTMRHHGTGFWDRGYKVATGKLLTELADRLGTEDASVYVDVDQNGARVPRLDYPA